jgi:CheY-like chemotaxis protein
VEDEDQVRRLASRQLRNKGYVVLEASNAAEAITVFQAHRQEIDLLLTDIVMPGMSGKQLSEQLLVHDPQLKTLFMSGYNEEIVDRHGHLDSSIPLLQKPFSAQDLSSLIRKVLDG